MPLLFVPTLLSYAFAILPWFAVGIVLAYIIEKNLKPQLIKQYLGTSDYRKVFMAQILGMISPLSIMSFLPIANEFIASGANPGMIFSFFIAERAYDLQSFFIIGSLFGIKFALLNAAAILLALLGAAYAIRHEKITFAVRKREKQHGFIVRQMKLLGIVIVGISIGAFLRVTIPTNEFSKFTGGTISGVLGGIILGFLLYLGPIVGNYPVAKAFGDLGMAKSGVFAFLTISPVVNLVVIMLFGAAVGYKNTYKAFLTYMIITLVLTILFTPFL